MQFKRVVLPEPEGPITATNSPFPTCRVINHPLLILADEPTGNLDSKSTRAVIRSFEQAKSALEATIFMMMAGSRMFCRTVRPSSRRKSWKTKPSCLLRTSATIFMVTHDSYAASFCDRVVILRDGVVWKVLEKGATERETFQDQLLDAVREMGRE